MYRFTKFSLEIAKYVLSGTSVNGMFYLECLLEDLFATFITFIDVLLIEPFFERFVENLFYTLIFRVF